MAKRVMQADGRYCYTENCRIHDRGDGANLTGVESVIYDTTRAQQRSFSDTIAEFIKTNPDAFGIHPVQLQLSNEVADKITETFYNEGDLAPAQLSKSILDAFHAEDKEVESDDLERLYAVGQRISFELRNKLIIVPGDEVLIKSSGLRGTVTEGTNFMNSLVRVNPEEENSFDYYKANDVIKVFPNDSNTAKETLLSSRRDTLIPASTMRDLLDQETDAKAWNPQAIKGLTEDKAEVVRTELTEAGEKFFKAFGEKTVTKARMFRFLKDEAVKRRSWLSDSDASVVHQAFNNVINYVNPRDSR